MCVCLEWHESEKIMTECLTMTLFNNHFISSVSTLWLLSEPKTHVILRVTSFSFFSSVWWAYDNKHLFSAWKRFHFLHSQGVCVCCGGGVVWRPLSYRAPLTHPDTKRLDHIHDPSVWENATLPPWPLELKSFLLPPLPSLVLPPRRLSRSLSLSRHENQHSSALWKFNHSAHRCL